MVVSVSGIIGFVGLIIPHIVRIVLGPDNRILLPSSALVGAIFMIFADTIARTIISPSRNSSWNNNSFIWRSIFSIFAAKE